MAIAFDNHASGDTVSAIGSLSYSHTVAGNNKILWVSVELYVNGAGTTGDKVSTVTYAGVSMTQVKKSLMPGGTYSRYAYLYMLVAPASGANNVVITATDATNRIIGYSSSYTGALQTGQPDASITNTGTNITSLSTSLTTIADRCWIVSTAYSDLTTIQGSTNVTIRDNAQFQGAIGDNNGDITPPQSYTMTWSGGTTATDFNVLQASFSPAPTGGAMQMGKYWGQPI